VAALERVGAVLLAAAAVLLAGIWQQCKQNPAGGFRAQWGMWCLGYVAGVLTVVSIAAGVQIVL
jgi:hypothetical protein